MSDGEKYLKLLEVPCLAEVKTLPSQPVVTLRIPSDVTLSLAYEPFEYTSLGFSDGWRNAEGGVNVSRNFHSFVNCADNYRELVGIFENVRSNVVSLLGEKSGLPSYKNPWEMVMDVSPELEPCIQQKIGEHLPPGVIYADRKLAFQAASFAALADLIRGFFQGGVDPDPKK